MANTLENKTANENLTLTKLTDEALISKIKNLAVIERKLTQVMISHVAEMDRRKLYLRMAYSSLYDYLTQEIGYSEGAAQRRIDAARLFQNVPELAQKIECGSIKLSQVSHVQKICRQVKKDSGQAVSIQLRQDILTKIENQNSSMTQAIVASALNIEPVIHEATRKISQADESVRVELTFSKEEFEILKQAEALLSNKTGGTIKSTILEMAHAMVKNRKPKVALKTESNIHSNHSNHSNHSDHSTQYALSLENNPDNETITNSKTNFTAAVTVTLKTKKLLHQRDQCCQFKDKSTGKMCGSKYFLEVDHIQPRFADGDNNFHNLRMLCRSHNQFRYRAGL